MSLSNNAGAVTPLFSVPVRRESLGVITSDIPAGTAKTSMPVTDFGVNLPSGSVLTIMNTLVNDFEDVTLSSAYSSGDTTITFSSVTFTSRYEIGCFVTMNKKNVVNKITTARVELYNVNVRVVFSVGNTNTNDYLSNYSHISQFNINASASLSDGDAKNNNWGSRYGCFVAPTNCKLTKVFGWINGNGISTSKPEALVLSIWKKDSTANGTATTRIYLLSQTTHTFPASSANNYVEQIIDTPSLVAIDKYDSVYVTVKRVGDEEHDRDATWYLDFELMFESTEVL